MSSYKRSVLIRGFELSPQLQQEALRAFTHRFTGEHVPMWSRDVAPNGSFYAPQYAVVFFFLFMSLFAVGGAGGLVRGNNVHCESTKPSFPWGTWLEKPFVRGTPLPASPEVGPSNAGSDAGPAGQ